MMTGRRMQQLLLLLLLLCKKGHDIGNTFHVQ
jgi:hypothetical protein